MRRAKQGRGKPPASRQSLRVIGGQWRGRRFDFPLVEGLRPTGDRIRETLFNWLQADVPEAVVLDLYAGSGALGLEAASRGAAQVVLNDVSPVVVRHLRDVVDTLGADQRVAVRQGSALDLLRQTEHKANIVFVDPPFSAELFDATLALLADGTGLAADAKIYLETPKGYGFSDQLEANFELLREKSSGQVDYRLLRRKAFFDKQSGEQNE